MTTRYGEREIDHAEVLRVKALDRAYVLLRIEAEDDVRDCWLEFDWRGEDEIAHILPDDFGAGNGDEIVLLFPDDGRAGAGDWAGRYVRMTILTDPDDAERHEVAAIRWVDGDEALAWLWNFTPSGREVIFTMPDGRTAQARAVPSDEHGSQMCGFITTDPHLRAHLGRVALSVHTEAETGGLPIYTLERTTGHRDGPTHWAGDRLTGRWEYGDGTPAGNDMESEWAGMKITWPEWVPSADGGLRYGRGGPARTPAGPTIDWAALGNFAPEGTDVVLILPSGRRVPARACPGGGTDSTECEFYIAECEVDNPLRRELGEPTGGLAADFTYEFILARRGHREPAYVSMSGVWTYPDGTDAPSDLECEWGGCRVEAARTREVSSTTDYGWSVPETAETLVLGTWEAGATCLLRLDPGPKTNARGAPWMEAAVEYVFDPTEWEGPPVGTRVRLYAGDGDRPTLSWWGTGDPECEMVVDLYTAPEPDPLDPTNAARDLLVRLLDRAQGEGEVEDDQYDEALAIIAGRRRTAVTPHALPEAPTASLVWQLADDNGVYGHLILSDGTVHELRATGRDWRDHPGGVLEYVIDWARGLHDSGPVSLWDSAEGEWRPIDL